MDGKLWGLAPDRSKSYFLRKFVRAGECGALRGESGGSQDPLLLLPDTKLGRSGWDRREVPNDTHGLYNDTFGFPLVVGFEGALSNFIFERLCFPRPSFITLALSLVPSRRDQLMLGYPAEPLRGFGGRLHTTVQRFGDTVCLAHSLATGLKCLERSPRSSASSSPLRGRTSRSAETASHSLVPRPGASATPRRPLEMHIHGSDPRTPRHSRMGPSNLCFNKPSREF